MFSALTFTIQNLYSTVFSLPLLILSILFDLVLNFTYWPKKNESLLFNVFLDRSWSSAMTILIYNTLISYLAYSSSYGIYKFFKNQQNDFGISMEDSKKMFCFFFPFTDSPTDVLLHATSSCKILHDLYFIVHGGFFNLVVLCLPLSWPYSHTAKAMLKQTILSQHIFRGKTKKKTQHDHKLTYFCLKLPREWQSLPWLSMYRSIGVEDKFLSIWGKSVLCKVFTCQLDNQPSQPNYFTMVPIIAALSSRVECKVNINMQR